MDLVKKAFQKKKKNCHIGVLIFASYSSLKKQLKYEISCVKDLCSVIMGDNGKSRKNFINSLSIPPCQ